MVAIFISIMKFLGKNIRHIRQKKGLSQEQFADDLKVTRSRICSYECGKSKPSTKFIFKLSNYAAISMDKILKENLSTLEL